MRNIHQTNLASALNAGALFCDEDRMEIEAVEKAITAIRKEIDDIDLKIDELQDERQAAHSLGRDFIGCDKTYDGRGE